MAFVPEFGGYVTAPGAGTERRRPPHSTRSPIRRALAAAVGWVAGSLFAAAALAGTLCGTVRDEQSGNPMDRAGIFLWRQTGQNTGLYGATDAAGHFCIASVPPGTYDVQVRRDDYQVAYLRNVVVSGSVTSVDIPAGLRIEFAPPMPNPAGRETGLRWTLPAPTTVRLSIHDLQGRLLRAWWSPELEAGSHSFTWDLRNGSGARVAPGLYLIRLETASTQLVRSVVVVR